MKRDRHLEMATAFATAAADASAGRLCDVCVGVLGVDGAGITLMDGNQVGPLCVTGRGATELEELQFLLGEGPCHDAFRSGRPVLIPRLDHDVSVRWLPFAEAAVGLGIGAVFAYPLVSDDIRLGVLTVYQREPGSLTGDQLEACAALSVVLADTISTMPTLSITSGSGAAGAGVEAAAASRAQVHQASGMVAAQLQISAPQALVRIRAHAFANDVAIKEVAGDIIARRLRLTDDRDGRAQEVGA